MIDKNKWPYTPLSKTEIEERMQDIKLKKEFSMSPDKRMICECEIRGYQVMLDKLNKLETR